MLYFFVPSVTEISYHVFAVQESLRVLIYDLNKKTGVLFKIVTRFAFIL